VSECPFHSISSSCCSRDDATNPAIQFLGGSVT
jgi:hypothetical protein